MPARSDSLLWLIAIAILGIVSCGVFSSSSPQSETTDSDDSVSPTVSVGTESVFVEPASENPSASHAQSFADGPPPPPGIPTSEEVFEKKDVPVLPGERLKDVFKKMRDQRKVPFVLSAPENNPEYKLMRVQIVRQFGDVSVVALFENQERPGQYLFFVQGEALQRIESCNDLALPQPPPTNPLAPEPTVPPVDCKSEDIRLGKIPARLLYIRNPIRKVKETHLIWDHNGVEFELAGIADGDDLVKIANSVVAGTN